MRSNVDFELVASYDLLEPDVGSFAKKIDGEQRDAALAGMPGDLRQELFLAVTGSPMQITAGLRCPALPGRKK